MHAGGQLVAAHARGQCIFPLALGLMQAIHVGKQVARRGFRRGADGTGRKEVVERFSLAAQDNALMPSGEEAVAPID